MLLVVPCVTEFKFGVAHDFMPCAQTPVLLFTNVTGLTSTCYLLASVHRLKNEVSSGFSVI